MQEELENLAPKRKQAKKDIEDAEQKKNDADEAHYKAYCFACGFEASMGMLKSSHPSPKVLSNAIERWMKFRDKS